MFKVQSIMVTKNRSTVRFSFVSLYTQVMLAAREVVPPRRLLLLLAVVLKIIQSMNIVIARMS